jgi:UMF1 family MFS transporter
MNDKGTIQSAQKQQTPKTKTLTVASWCLYDFANSAFTTIVVTFIFSAFFTTVIAVDQNKTQHISAERAIIKLRLEALPKQEGKASSAQITEKNKLYKQSKALDEQERMLKTVGASYWSWAVSLTAIIVALLSPFMGAVADRGGFRKRFLISFTLICILFTFGLYFVLPGQILMALSFFVIANIAFEMGCVFYNAFLPDIASPQQIGRISGFGWAAGYIGGLLPMLIAFYFLIDAQHLPFGLSTENYGAIRATNLLVALWFLLFSIPMLLWVKEDTSKIDKSGEPLFSSTIKQLRQTFTEIKQYRQIVRFLIARLIFNDGLVTIFFFGGIFAAAEYGFTTKDLIVFGIYLNITAAIGAVSMGFLDDYIGGKKTILISIIGLGLCTIVVLAFKNQLLFWIAAGFVGVFSGPNQSASRSLMGRFVPKDKENEFFGFFAFSGKATAFLGPMIFGFLTALSGSQRVGMLVVVMFFIIGGLILSTVNEAEGIKLAAGSTDCLEKV